MQSDGCVVKVAQDMNAERIYNAVRNEYCSIYPNSLSWSGFVRGLDRCGDAYQTSTAEGDASCYCNLAEEVEPVTINMELSRNQVREM